jgi:hypothetical protein
VGYPLGGKAWSTADLVLAYQAPVTSVSLSHLFPSSTLVSPRLTRTNEQLTNVDDCIKKGYIPAGTTPLEVASQQLLKDGITVIHTIGGDDTNTQAAHLSDYLKEKHDGKVIVIGMPKVCRFGCSRRSNRSTPDHMALLISQRCLAHTLLPISLAL